MTASIRSRRLRGFACACVLSGLLAGCGGDSSNANNSNNGSGNPPGGGNPPETIQGIPTPSSVAVVTATNAD